MESKQVISSIREIYSRFPITETLKLHMCRAASVGELVCDHLDKKEEGAKDAIAALLLHDLGNIVKFKLDEAHADLLGRESGDVAHWKRIQDETIAKYGSNDDHDVTNAMVKGLGVCKNVADIVDCYWESSVADPSGQLPMTICAYGDMRAGPFGIITVDERYADLLRRYKGDWREAKFRESQKHALATEKYLLGRTDLRPSDVNNESIGPYLSRHLKALGL